MKFSKKANEEFPCPSCGKLREYADCIQNGQCDQCPSLLSKKDDSYSDETQWPGQAASEDTLSRPQGAYAYSPEKQGGKKKKLNVDKVIQVLNEKGPKVVNLDVIHNTITLEDGSVLSFDEAVNKAMELNKNADGGIIDSSWSQNFFWSPEDIGADDQKSPFPNTNWLPADDQNLDEQPYSNIAASKKISKRDLKAQENILTQEQQNEIAAKWTPAMNILLDNYVGAVKNGHDKERALAYAMETVQTMDKSITKDQAVDAINTYLKGLV